MKVWVTGCDSDRKSSYIINSVKFYAGLLLEESVTSDLSIEVEIKYDLDAAGHCLTEDAEDYPRAFTIELNPNMCDGESMYATLAHEMVHVKQYALGELYNVLALTPDQLSFTNKHIWKGEPWEPNPREDDYFDSPWEVEAFGRQVGLYYRWKNRNEEL